MSGENEIKGVFSSKHFTEQELARVLNLSKSNAHYIRHKLLKDKKIVRVKRGVYRLGMPSFFKADPILEFIQKNLLELNKKFVITAAAFFNRFYPFSNYIVVYVEKNTINEFTEKLESLKLNFTVLNEPKSSDIELLRDKAHIRNFIILREKNYFYSSKEGLASLESAFVDYYFEVTRKKLPLDNKAVEILDYLLTHAAINVSTMLRYAKERGIRKEIEELFKGIKFGISNDGEKESKKDGEKENENKV